MLDPEIFAKKYKTNSKQKHEESFLETVSKEDREKYDDVEILTGRTPGYNGKSHINKFHQTGFNKGKKYKTTRRRMIESFEKYMDNKIVTGEITEFWDTVFNSGKKGNFSFANMFLERALGKEADKVDLTVEDFNFKIELDSNSKERQNQNKEEDKD